MNMLNIWIIICILHIQFILLNGVVTGVKVTRFKSEQRSPGFISPVIKVTQERLVPCSDNDIFNGNNDYEVGSQAESSVQERSCYSTIETEYSNVTENTVLGQPQDRLKFSCEAPYLTIWNTTITPTKEARYKESRRYDQNPFLLDTVTFINEFKLIIKGGTSGWINCVGKPIVNNSVVESIAQVYIFAQDGSHLVKFGADAEGSILLEDISGYLRIPCLANYPYVQVKLQQETELFEFEEVDQSRIIAPYDPRKGFVVQGTNASEQTYKCLPDDYEDVIVYYKQVDPQKGNKLNLYTGGLGINDTEKQLDIFCHLNATRTKIMFLKMIRCGSPNQCDWLKVCFDKCWLDHDVEKQEVSVTGFVAVLKNPYPTGVVVCVVAQDNVPSFAYYFIGLDRLSYFKNHPYPKHAVIRIETQEENFYTYQETKFKCSISTFILVSNIKFAILYKNKTTVLLDAINPNGDPSLLEYEYPGFAQREIAINLTKDMTDLICMAPHFDSKEWINVSIAFVPKDVLLPSIQQSNDKEEFVDITLYSGGSNQVLYCSATGDPKPEIIWVLPNELTESVLKFTKHLEGESTLLFPSVESYFAGKYTCVAKNVFGNKSLDFYVKVDDGSLGSLAVIGICSAVVLFLVLIIVLVYFLYQWHVTRDSMRNLTEDEINYFTNGRPQSAGILKPEDVDGPEVAKCMGFNQSYVIAEKDLIIAKNCLLGQGEYGMVYRGFLFGDGVAVKTTKPDTDVSYVKALLSELKIMAYIGDHPHVVRFMGAVVSRIKERIVYAVVELSPVGNLHSFLRNIDEAFLYLPKTDTNAKADYHGNRKPSHPMLSKGLRVSSDNCPEFVTTKNLIHWGMQIADGMNYLARKKVIHGDLAARNILVFKNEMMKITDFGLSRQMYTYSKYVKKQQAPLPWRWLAVESLRYFEFSSESDVWSFGITMWEIFTLGETPYPGRNWTMDFAEKLSNGYRMKMPKNTPKFIWEVMKSCWHNNPSDRPTFADLRDYLKSQVKLAE